MCREVCELVKTFLFPLPVIKQEHHATPTSITLTSTSSSSVVDPNQMDENGVGGGDDDLEQMKSTYKDDTAASSTILSEMAMSLLKSNKNIYQSTLLLLFEGIHYLCFKKSLIMK
jgi:hypothetical protein